MIDTTALLDAVSWLNEALKDRAGVGIYPGQLQTIFTFGGDGTERRRLLNDLAAMGGRGGELSQAAAEVLKVLEGP